MVNIQEIPHVLDREVIFMTKALAGLELEKVDSQLWNGVNGVADVIHTSGCLEACIICEAEQNIFRHIISAMHGGDMPPAEEQALYINEYMNIICGRIVSRLNNLTGKVSKLSVPEYFGESKPACEQRKGMRQTTLAYRTEQGFIRFTIQYTFQQNGGEML